MPALVSGYESSDDEAAPVASTSTNKLPTLGNGYAAAEDEEEDDDKIEEQARADAFGLTTQQKEEIQRSDAKAVVKAAPDVLKEVRMRHDQADYRTQTAQAWRSLLGLPTKS